MRTVASVGMAVMVALATAPSCTVEGDVDDSGLETVVINQPAVAQVPTWASPHTDELQTGVSMPTDPMDPSDPIDPCTCTTDECLDDWIDDTLGCGICIVVFCGGEPHIHHCSFCLER